MIEKHTKDHAKSDGFCLDMCACDSDLAGQDGLALENTNEANQPKMARQRYDQQGAWASGKCMKYRRWTYRHNVFPCGCPAAHLLVSRLIASSTWRRQGFSEPPVCDTVFASLSVPCADLFVHEVGKNVWQLHRGLEITSRFSSLVCMYDIDRFYRIWPGTTQFWPCGNISQKPISICRANQQRGSPLGRTPCESAMDQLTLVAWMNILTTSSTRDGD